MRVKSLYILCLMAAVFLLLSGCAPRGGDVLKENAFTPPAPADTAEQACLDFVQNQLAANGGIYTNYLSGSAQGDLAQGHEVLSESQGLMLRYYAAIADEEGFSQTLGYITQMLDTGALLSYRVGEEGSRFSTNAAIDDLRILRGLLEGAQVFSQPDYRKLCQNWAKRLYKTNVKDDFLLDCYDETLSFAGRVSTLCFSDLETMQLLGSADRRWNKVERKMRDILKQGYLGDHFPFFQTRYDIDSEAYEAEQINMVEALLTAVHLSQVGECPAATVRWVKEALSQGAIYGAYTPQGVPVNTIESTAIYALCALLGGAEGDQALVEAAMEKLRGFQITDKQSTLYGAFADAATLKAYSFDNLMALAALRTQAQNAVGSEKGEGA
ncbi:hypothetical protein ACS3UN_00995 [Oscillospiraceae bacterium LTW-04]|nr:hypothetical protein RBH76_09450 [Oscillospiraceae bacterium MB24-C1]